MNKNTTLETIELYDAIVIGSGISGGWAAKELCESGLKTLVLERGRMVKHIEGYPTMHMDPWDFENRGEKSKQLLERKPKQNRTGYTTHPQSEHFFVDDIDHPYNETKRFDWMRGYHVGGRSITWGRHCYRWSAMDFESNKNDGHGVDWPIRYHDISPWYDKVEEYIGIQGENMDLPQLPNGKYTAPFEFNCVEEHLREQVTQKFDDRIIAHARTAHITGDKQHEGRTSCQYRNRCIRGCPFGGYFSSLSSTLPAAERTGNMVLRPNSIVHEIVYDDTSKLATGVKVIDANTKEETIYSAKVIFSCASAIASASILMQSKSERFPNGLGNDSGELGHNIMDHHLGVGASAEVEGFEESYYKGRKPAGIYIPRFRNVDKKSEQKDYIRGFGYQGGARRSNWQRGVAELSYGKKLKEELLKPGAWSIGVGGFGECLPYHENKMTLDYDNPDQWGLPTITFDAEFKENEKKMRKDMQAQAIAILKAGGFKNVRGFDRSKSFFPGLGIHEMGTARMGKDPKTSVLNKHNQIHTVKNVYVTDGACMTSSACQNPSLTYMALTARAAAHAVQQLKENKFKNA